MKRYDFDEGYRYDSTGGEYVLYEDVMKRIKELEDMLRRWIDLDSRLATHDEAYALLNESKELLNKVTISTSE